MDVKAIYRQIKKRRGRAKIRFVRKTKVESQICFCMYKFFSLMTAVFLCFSITACSHVSDPRPSKNNAVSNKETVTDRLYSQYDKWKGVRYKMGGLSKNGVDCSGFVYLTYLELFGKKLPRSTRVQSRVGKDIQRDKWRSGDLVFFKTGWTVRHVGIYLEINSFMHASKKKGIIISSLDDPYWKSKYWKTKRVDF